MIEIFFWIAFLLGVGILAAGIYSQNAYLTALAAIVILITGALIATEGIEREPNYRITEYTDLNTADINSMPVAYTAENSLSMYLISNLFIFGGIVVLLYSFGYLVYNR